jgi:tRNA dimethylallyltransferase
VTRVVAVVGPTATGKSDLGVALAQELGGEVVNADSMQLYAGMDIGTAKLTVAERQGVPHHLLDLWPVTRTASVADYQLQGRAVLDALLARGVTPVVVGGSGLYLRALLDDLSFPGTDPEVRAALEAELAEVGPAVLHDRLAGLSAEAAGRMERTNGRRIVRALEVIALTGEMPGAMTTYTAVYPTAYVGLDSADLAERVAARVERMWAGGLVEEVAHLAGLREGATARRALGYAQALGQLDGEVDEATARELTTVATRRFVRRQRGWFRRDPRIRWVARDGSELAQALEFTRSSDQD